MMPTPDLPTTLQCVENWRANTDRIVFTNGVFDLLHVGHVRYLTEAKSLGDRLIVGVNSDDSVRRLKGPDRPVYPAEQRAEILLALQSVDAVCIFSEDTPSHLIETLKPDIHVKGGDYRIEDLPEARVVRSYGGEVRVLRFFDGHSSSHTMERIQDLKQSP
ncbi:MAG: D-glycero-beta-D-manno-heptose 1-phosphate adenylyltransferase [Fimbriimonadaceae bacterium]|nr:D-glycero-beta-D-manno-heptose 1-phosphate adenylyltransferase [Fimbriimonadaceae bacterium]